MTAIVTAGMWLHVILNAWACDPRTKNPIWGELRLVLVVVSTIAVWAALASNL